MRARMQSPPTTAPIEIPAMAPVLSLCGRTIGAWVGLASGAKYEIVLRTVIVARHNVSMRVYPAIEDLDDSVREQEIGSYDLGIVEIDVIDEQGHGDGCALQTLEHRPVLHDRSVSGCTFNEVVLDVLQGLIGRNLVGSIVDFIREYRAILDYAGRESAGEHLPSVPGRCNATH